MNTGTLLSAGVGLLPVLLFLGALVLLDSFKLVRMSAVLLAIGFGALCAGVAYAANRSLLGIAGVDELLVIRYAGPFLEEALKSLLILFLLRRGRIGFMVDGAIYGFAIGAGFSLVENLYYLSVLDDGGALLWFVRGVGTAVMHGGTTAIVGIVTATLAERSKAGGLALGLLIAFAIHSGFNHVLISPVRATFLNILLLPAAVVLVFRQSEKALQQWLGLSFDEDVEMMRMINSGEFAASNVGKYLLTLRDRFPGEAVADMLCLIRLHTELALKAKATLLMREAGLDTEPEPEVEEKLREMAYLERSIGATGRLALAPIFRTSSRDLWQFYVLGKS